jgi:hypothetical protein
MATAKKKPAGPANKGLRIVARVDGFRRAGRAWPAAGVDVPFDELDADQVEALKNESMLVVSEVDIESAPADPKA